jgi:hypothetical protein
LKEANELYDDWYQEEDYNGNIGEEGMIRSYDIGTYYIGTAEEDAKENGFNDVAEYLQYWFSEIQGECPWYWTKVGHGYGYNGNTIFKHDGVVCKDIYGQIMVDEYPIADPRRDQVVGEARIPRNNQHYTHFAVNKATNKIVNGWDYKGYDPQELRQFKKDYFVTDLMDYDLDPKQYKILTAKSLMRMGIDPNDNGNWAQN